ncbi:YqaJ viral recombinase family nuclease [Marinisporobacter balticus]|uniref:Putative phage-type endonuclease n=1 Tax=Marinisporobacter balticus TaxID=2018667 RepID=A0A4R2L5E6_9FIRM|nr:YqaJ viral recombinase family protein [Marinisporobacter balticus]TCO79106.1 putative phage-type endonuclease [Marinisporobacter balticus]
MQAKVLVNTLNMNHDEWLGSRTKGIGGSDAAAIAGLNPWKSPISVFLDKTGKADPVEDNERMRIGRDLEDYVAKRFEEATEMKVRRRNAILQHPKYDFMFANVDRLIVGKNEGLECKTTNSYAKSEWEEGIPLHYEIQCLHYMAVTGADAWWIACLIGNEKFVYKRIERDESAINHLINIEKEFWEDHVLANEMPAPDGSKDADGILREMYSSSDPGTVINLEGYEFELKIQRLDEIKGMINKLETEKKQMEQDIQLQMGENETALIGDRKITWKTSKSNRFDSKRFKMDHPEMYKDYINESVSRRFLIK